jgi:hypothetical protein
MVLSRKLGAGEITEVEGFDRGGLQIRIPERFFPGGDRQSAQILIREDPEGSFSRSNYCNLS